MCHGYDYEWIKNARIAEQQRRSKEQASVMKKPGDTAVPAAPTETKTHVKEKMPVPA